MTRPDLKIVGYGYDAAGNRTRLYYPNASFVTYAFDELGRMTEVRDGGVTLLALYAYDPLSRLTTTTTNNGAQITHDYELDDDLTQVAQSYGVGSVTFDYLYNLVNQRTDTTVDDNAYLWFPDLGVTNDYVSNALNQYDDVDGTLYSYDGNGNLTGDGVDTYLYDVESRLISATTPQNLADYTYDPQGRRGEKDVDGTVTKYVYAGDTVIAEYDGLDQLQARYVPGLGVDRPVLMIRGATYSYYHYDGSGSVIAMTDVFGVVVENYAFGPYGESSDPDALANPYRYTGRRLDAETGLYYYRARYYSAELGRFLQADPAGHIDGLNLYAYVRNDPLNFIDPFGLATTYLFGGGGSLIGITGGEASSGVAFSGSDDWVVMIGIFGSVGLGAGVNVSVDVFYGKYYDSIAAMEGTTVNQNVTVWYGSGTVFFDPSTGEELGYTAGLGPGATPVGGSTTYSFTAPVPLFDVDFGFVKSGLELLESGVDSLSSAWDSLTGSSPN